MGIGSGFGGADPLTQSLTIDGVPREVIGVLPQWFKFFDYPADIFYPLQPVRANAMFPAGDGRGIARLKPGVTLAQANADVARLIPILDQEFPGLNAEQLKFRPKLRWLKDSIIGDLRDTLWLLMGTTGVLMLIACANVSNLVLARTQTRRPELATRAALGAGWAAIARVVLAESTVLGLIGGVAGVLVAYLSLPVLLRVGAADLPRMMVVDIDVTVLLVALVTSALASLTFALIPVLNFALPKHQIANELRGGVRTVTDGHAGNRARQLLVVAQVALTLVLLVGSGLMIRTFVTLSRVDPGFGDAAKIQTFQLNIPTSVVPDATRAGAHDPRRTIRMQHEIVDRVGVVSGVGSVGFSSSNDGLPLDGDGRTTLLFVEGRAMVDETAPPKEFQAVSPGFFETMQTPVVAGRAFDWNDVHQDRAVVLVSENLARAEWGSARGALGKRIATSRSGRWSEVVGVVKDVRHYGLRQSPPETVIVPADATNTVASFVIRSERVGTRGFVEELQTAVRSVNTELSLANVQTMGDLYRRSTARTSMTLQLLAMTGTIALVLGLVGIYGIVSYAISQRRREIAIRLALGATQGEVRRMFVRSALTLVGTGVAIGFAATISLTPLVKSQLFGVSPLDPMTHLAMALLLIAAAGLASYVSAHRASALSPIDVLKEV
jgi:putative ABC transport system permease protein